MGRSSLISEVWGNSLWIFGGYNGNMVLNDMFEFKLNSIDQHPPSLVNDMRRFMLNEELSDVTFVVEGREIHACKALLASRSDYFMAMFFAGLRESAADSHKPIVVNDVSFDVFQKIIEFLYTDSVKELSPDLAIAVLIASELFLIPRLKSICEEEIKRRIEHDNVVGIFIASSRHRADDLKEISLNFILENLDVMKMLPSFKDLTAEPELLLEIVMKQGTILPTPPRKGGNSEQLHSAFKRSGSRGGSGSGSRGGGGGGGGGGSRGGGGGGGE